MIFILAKFFELGKYKKTCQVLKFDIIKEKINNL
jgi:hypothetical protein